MALFGTDRRTDRLTGVARRQQKVFPPVPPFPALTRRQLGTALLALPMLVVAVVPAEAANNAAMLVTVPW
jgi:hypothetical protein